MGDLALPSSPRHTNVPASSSESGGWDAGDRQLIEAAAEDAHGEEHGEEDAHGEEHGEEDAHGEEHGEEDAHGEEHGGEGHHTEVTKTSFIIAVMLMMFFVLNMFMLYMVNYRDPNIRSYIFQMLDSMISIFVAVIFNEAMVGFFLEQILPSPPPRGFGLPETRGLHCSVGLVMYLVFTYLLNIVSFRYRDDPNWLYGSRKMLGHISAFAGLFAFSHVQSMFPFPGIGLVVAFMVTAANLALWDQWRDRSSSAPSPSDQEGRSRSGGLTYLFIGTGVEGGDGTWQVMLSNEWCDYPPDVNDQLNAGINNGDPTIDISLEIRGAKREYVVERVGSEYKQKAKYGDTDRARRVRCVPHVANDEWKEDVFESELDATCLVLSFLTLQICLYKISGSLPDLHSHDSGHPKPGYLSKLSISGAVFLMAVAVLTILRGMIKSDQFIKSGTVANRMMNGFQTYLAMCMSWCLLTVGHWAILEFIPDAEMAMVANAFALTALAVFVVVGLDKFADTLLESEGRLDQQENEEVDMQGDVVRTTSTMGGDGDDLMAKAFHVLSPLKDVSLHEKALRKLIESAGLLVGIVWEKALTSANVSLENFIPFTKRHIVITKISLASLIVVLVMPAYLWYIVPIARRSWRHWARIMRTEDLQPVLEKIQRRDWLSVNKQLDKLEKKGHLLEDINADIKNLQYIQSRLRYRRSSSSSKVPHNSVTSQ